jgi:hypothetical protein
VPLWQLINCKIVLDKTPFPYIFKPRILNKLVERLKLERRENEDFFIEEGKHQ